MKAIYLIFSLLMLTLPSWAQSTGSIRGTVETFDGNPAEYVNVSIEGFSKGTAADSNGNFQMTSLAPGINCFRYWSCNTNTIY
jgi:iron complex outermembrane receptor protein